MIINICKSYIASKKGRRKKEKSLISSLVKLFFRKKSDCPKIFLLTVTEAFSSLVAGALGDSPLSR